MDYRRGIPSFRGATDIFVKQRSGKSAVIQVSWRVACVLIVTYSPMN